MLVGSFGGHRKIMEKLAQMGPFYQAGTLSGNLLVTVAGLACLTGIAKQNIHKRLTEITTQLAKGLKKKS